MANVKVALRVRPLSKRENTEGARIIVNVDGNIVRIRNIKLDYKPESCGDTRERLMDFGFDYCYCSVDPEDPKYASQEVVFQDLGTVVVSEAIKGYNVCLFAYGQTGSGKTYTMIGTPTSVGLTPRICEGLFSYNDDSPGSPSSCRIEVSFLEIYNERVRDLLHQSDQKKPYTLRVREHPEKGPYVQGLSQHVVTDYEHVVAFLEKGMENRITAATHIHDASSRSHAIFTIQYTQAMLENNLPSEITSKINLVDLAGSERASPNYCKDRLTEGSNINRSLVTLGIVISALAQNSQMSSSSQSINSIMSDGDSGIPGSPSGSSSSGTRRQPFIPYRDSILTWLLKDSLGGNSKTVMIATVSPASSSYNETMSTLRYASSAKNIINKPRVNEDANVKLIRELREEINRLKAMLRNFEMRTISPSFSEERDGNITDLVLQNELKIEQLTKDWTDKWTDKDAIMEQYNVDINKGKASVTIDSSLPHLIAMDDDILSTGVVIYHLKEGATKIGKGEHDIVLQGDCIANDHCIIENNFGVVELQPSPGALCIVNGQEVTEVCRLSQGAVLVFGKSHRFRFNHPAEAAVLRQRRSDSQASFVSDCSLDWLDLSGDFSSPNENSLILNKSNTEPLSEEYQQRLRALEATYQQQVEEQQRYVEDLKRQIQAAQAKGEQELEQEQTILNERIQENHQWLVEETQRLTVIAQQRRDSAAQTEPKSYAEAEVQNCGQTNEIQPSLEEHDKKRLVQLELLRKCSLRKAERNIRRKRVKFQLERIAKKQKLLEAKKTLQQLQAACWSSDDLVKQTSLHVPKLQEPPVFSTAFHRSRSSPSGFSYHRRCSLNLQTLPSYSGLLKRKCKSELVHNSKLREDNKPLRTASTDCLLKNSSNFSSCGQLDSDLLSIGTGSPQVPEKRSIESVTIQNSTYATLIPSDPQMSKKRPKMDKAGGRAKGSSPNCPAEPLKKRNTRGTVNAGSKDTKLKAVKSPPPTTAGGATKNLVQKGKLPHKNETVKSPPDKFIKKTQKATGQEKSPSGESLSMVKITKRDTTSSMTNTQKKLGTSKISLSVDNISKLSNHSGDSHAVDTTWLSTEKLNRGSLKSNLQTLEKWKENEDDSDPSDSESFYSVDSLSSAYVSALNEQLKQEERQKNTAGQNHSDSEDSEMSQDSLVDRDSGKERPNKRRFNKYKTIVSESSPSRSLSGDPNYGPLVTTGSVTTGFSKSFSLDSLADSEEVPEADSFDEPPAEIYWKLQSPRCLAFSGEDQKKAGITTEEVTGLERSGSFFLMMNESSTSECSDGKDNKMCNSTFVLDNTYTSPALAGQNPSMNTPHEDHVSSVLDVLDAEINNSHLRDDLKLVFTEQNALKDTITLSFQGREPHDKEINMDNDEVHKRNTSDNSPVPREYLEPIITAQTSTKQENVNESENAIMNKIKCTTVKTQSEKEVETTKLPEHFMESQEKPTIPFSYDDKSVILISEPISEAKTNYINRKESLLDLNRRVKTTSNKDDFVASVEHPVIHGIDVPYQTEIMNYEQSIIEQILTQCSKSRLVPSNTLDIKKSTSQVSLTNANKDMKQNIFQQLCSKEILSDTCNFDQKKKCENTEMFNPTLTQGMGETHLQSTTEENLDQNKNVTPAIPVTVQQDNLNKHRQVLSFICLESTESDPLVPSAGRVEIGQERLTDNANLLKIADKIKCDFTNKTMLSQIAESAVELDKNANKDCKTETQPISDTNNFNIENLANSFQRDPGEEPGQVIQSGENYTRSALSVINDKLLPVEDQRHSVFNDQSEVVGVFSPAEYILSPQQKNDLTFLVSYQNINKYISQCSRIDDSHSSHKSDEHCEKPGHSAESITLLQGTTQGNDMKDICASPIHKIAGHLLGDPSTSISIFDFGTSLRENAESFSENNCNVLSNPGENSCLSVLATKKSDVKTVNNNISLYTSDYLASKELELCVPPNIKEPEIHEGVFDFPYVKGISQRKCSEISSNEVIGSLSIPSDTDSVDLCNVFAKAAKDNKFSEDKENLPNQDDDSSRSVLDQSSTLIQDGVAKLVTGSVYPNFRAEYELHDKTCNDLNVKTVEQQECSGYSFQDFICPEENKMLSEDHILICDQGSKHLLTKTFSSIPQAEAGLSCIQICPDDELIKAVETKLLNIDDDKPDKNKNKLKYLHKVRFEEFEQVLTLGEENQAHAAEGTLAKHSNVFTIGEAANRDFTSTMITISSNQRLDNKSNSEDPKNYWCEFGNQKFEVAATAPKTEVGSPMKEKKPMKNNKTVKCNQKQSSTEVTYSKDISDMQNSESSWSTHQKPSKSYFMQNHEKEDNTTDISCRVINSTQEGHNNSDNGHVTEDISGTVLVRPYYEAKMQNELCLQSEYNKSKSPEKRTCCRKRESCFDCKQTELEMNPSCLNRVHQNDTNVSYASKGIDISVCSEVLKCKPGEMFFKPEEQESEVGISYGVENAESGNLHVVANSGRSTVSNIVMSKQHDSSTQEDMDSVLVGTNCSSMQQIKSAGKLNHFQCRPEKPGQLDQHDMCHKVYEENIQEYDDKSPDENTLTGQQAKFTNQNQITVSPNYECPPVRHVQKYIKDTTSMFHSQTPESDPCRPEVEYSGLNVSKNGNNLLSSASVDSSKQDVQSGKLTQVGLFQKYQLPECTVNSVRDTKSNHQLCSEYCVNSPDAKVPVNLISQADVSVDLEHLGQNPVNTTDVSHVIMNEKELPIARELELQSDKTASSTIFDTRKVTFLVSSNIEQNDLSEAVTDRFPDNSSSQNTNLMTTTVFGKNTSDLDQSPDTTPSEEDTETSSSFTSSDVTVLSENRSLRKEHEEGLLELSSYPVSSESHCTTHSLGSGMPANVVSSESCLMESSILLSAQSLSNTRAEASSHRCKQISDYQDISNMESQTYSHSIVTDCKTLQIDDNQPTNVTHRCNSVVSEKEEDIGNIICFVCREPSKQQSPFFQDTLHQVKATEAELHQAKTTNVEVSENNEGLHFSSSDINPFVHSWQQKPGWRSCTFNSASDVSYTKFNTEADKLTRCSSVDEGLNAHNSTFHSHLSCYANAKTLSSTISSFGGNDSRPDLDSLDSSQDHFSDETSAICGTGDVGLVGTSGLETKLEDFSQLDEIMVLFTSESETCNEANHKASYEHGAKSRHRKVKHQRSLTDGSSGRQVRSRKVYPRPASWSNVQNMSLHLSQLLQETSELLGNLSQHHSQNIHHELPAIQRDAADLILKRSVRDSATQTSVDKSIQTDSDNVLSSTNAQINGMEHKRVLNSAGINVIVKVMGAESLTHIPQNCSLTVEQNGCKVPKTRTQSLPNLSESVSCKQLAHDMFQSHVQVSTPFLNGSQDMASQSLPPSSTRCSQVSASPNKDSEDITVNSSSSSVTYSPRYHISCSRNTKMVDRATSPILTLSASKTSLHKSVPENSPSTQNFVKVLRKRRECGFHEAVVNTSQTESDSEGSYVKPRVQTEFEIPPSNSLRESQRRRIAAHKVQRFRSEGCILHDVQPPVINHYSSQSETSDAGRSCKLSNYFTTNQQERATTSAALPPWRRPQSLDNLSQVSQPVLLAQNTNRTGKNRPKGSKKDCRNDENDIGHCTTTLNNSYIKRGHYPYSASQASGFDLPLHEDDGLSVLESECNTDILLGQQPSFTVNQKDNHALQNLPMHNKFSNWSGVLCNTPTNVQALRGSAEQTMKQSPTKSEASEELDHRSREIERLQRERAEIMSGIHLEMNTQPLTVQLAEAKISYGIGETDALLRVIQTGKMEDTISIKKQLYDRHMKVIENLRKEREERLQSFRRSRSLSPQKHLSASLASLTSLRDCDLPSRRREYLQQLRKDVVDNTRIQEPKRTAQCPSEIEVMLKDYQKAREEAKTEIARARDKLRERAELEKRRLQQNTQSKEDTKLKTLLSTSTLFTSSSLSLSSEPTSGYNSGMTTTPGKGSKLSSQETKTSPRSLDQQMGSGRGRTAVRNSHLVPSQNVSMPDPPGISPTSPKHSTQAEPSLVPGKTSPCSVLYSPVLQSSPAPYQELATQVQARAMAEVMAACCYDLQNLYHCKAAAGWIYKTTEKDVNIYYKAFSSPTKHGFLGAGVIKRPLHDVWCMVTDVGRRRLYDQSILTADVHQVIGSSIQLGHVALDTSLCYLKQPRDFCYISAQYKEEQCYSLCFQSLYNESMPRPSKDIVRGEILPSAWLLCPDIVSGESVTRVIYMVQVDLGAPAIPPRLLSVVSKQQPLVVANLAQFLCR